LKLIVKVAASDGVSVAEVAARGVDDLAMRAALMIIDSEKQGEKEEPSWP